MASRRTLVVHIGLPKTGSTSIQRMLWTLAGPLRTFGVHVPVAGQEAVGRHGGLVVNRYRGSAWSDLQGELQRCRDARRFVISHELFTPANVDAQLCIRSIVALADAADLDVELVGYVRPQDTHIESIYVERVKSGHTMDFETFRMMVLRDSFLELDYNRRFQPWRSVFGRRLTIYPLDPARMPSGLLPHFLDVLGVSGLAATAARLPRLNQRIGAKCVEVMRLINVALAREMTGGAMEGRFRAYVRSELPGILHDDAAFVGLDEDRRRAVIAHYADSNARFAREYGIDAGGALFSREAGDGGGRTGAANLAGWWDLSDEERRVVVPFVRNAVGVDLPRTIEACGYTGPSWNGPPLKAWPRRSGPGRWRSWRSWHRLRRLRLILIRALRDSAPHLLARLAERRGVMRHRWHIARAWAVRASQFRRSLRGRSP